MLFKLLFFVVAAACLAQVLAQVQGAPRDLTADIAAAVVSTEALVGTSEVLIAEEEAFYNVVATDVFAVLEGVLARLAEFGVSQASLDQLLTNMSLAHLNIQTVVSEQVFYVTELIELLSSVLGDLASNLENLENDSGSLTEQRDKIHVNFINGSIQISIEMNRIENNIADLTVGLTLEQAGEVETEMARARGMVTAQRDLVVAAKRAVDAGVEDLTGQLDNIVVQLPHFRGPRPVVV